MQILINNTLAVLKENSSFEFVAENRMFSGSDGYTLSISFPLRGCPQNIAVFGHLYRADIEAHKAVFDCEIRDKNFYKFGCLTITEIDDAEVKCQFLEGRSEQNFNTTFDDIYINELNLGAPESVNPTNISPTEAWRNGVNDLSYVALPWVNDYSGNIQNCAVPSGNTYSWHEETRGLSWQPYLLFITKKICSAAGYTYDFTQWEAHKTKKYLLVCNTLPYAWYSPAFARALPHWSLTEWFEKLELFLDGEFDIDHRAKHISFAFTEEVVNTLSPVVIDNIIDEHSVEVSVEEENSEYSEAKNLVYAECDHNMWKYYCCDWLIDNYKNSTFFSIYDTFAQLVEDNKGYAHTSRVGGRNTSFNNLLYAADIDRYFVIRVTRKELLKEYESPTYNTYNYYCTLQPLNEFGGRIVDDSEDADEDEIEFVPACIDYTDDTYGQCLFLALSSYDDDSESSAASSLSFRDYEGTLEDYLLEKKNEHDAAIPTGRCEAALIAGEQDKKAEVFDKVYIGWWNGEIDTKLNGKLPHPAVSDLEMYDDWTYRFADCSLRINNRASDNAQRHIPQINPKVKSTFKFLADNIPNPRAPFLIRGKKYVCEKITATFSDKGMSSLLKATLYPVAEEDTPTA